MVRRHHNQRQFCGRGVMGRVRRLLSSLMDSMMDIPDPVESSAKSYKFKRSSRSSKLGKERKGSIKGSFTSVRGFGTGSDKRSKDEEVQLLTELRRERRKTRELEGQLHAILSLNTEMRAMAASRVDQERRLRMDAEQKAKDAKICLAQVRKSLTALQTEKDLLEAELLEAAQDFLAQRSYQAAFQERMEGENAAWELLEQRSRESEELDKRLKLSELQRQQLMKSLTEPQKQLLQLEEFELLKDSDVPATASQTPLSPLRSPRSSRSSLPPIVEEDQEEECLSEREDTAEDQGSRTLASISPDSKNEQKQRNVPNGLTSNRNDLSFRAPPHSSNSWSTVSANGGAPVNAKPALRGEEGARESDSFALEKEMDELSLVSPVSSRDSFEIPDCPEVKTVGDYIMTFKP